MSIAALIRGMAAAGAPPEAIALAVEAIEQRDAVDEARRAQARDKKRRQRGTVPGQSRDGEGTVPAETPAPSPSSSPDPSNNPTPTHGETPRARKGTRIPEDWRPATLNPETVSGEVVGRRGQEWARRALESFKNHWRSANGPTATKRDWQAAWANWIIEQDNRDGRRNGNERMAGNGRGGSPSGMGPTIDAADRFLARRELSGTT